MRFSASKETFSESISTSRTRSTLESESESTCHSKATLESESESICRSKTTLESESTFVIREKATLETEFSETTLLSPVVSDLEKELEEKELNIGELSLDNEIPRKEKEEEESFSNLNLDLDGAMNNLDAFENLKMPGGRNKKKGNKTPMTLMSMFEPPKDEGEIDADEKNNTDEKIGGDSIVSSGGMSRFEHFDISDQNLKGLKRAKKVMTHGKGKVKL